MVEKQRTLDRLYIATPCNADWESMAGNEQVRFCNQCQLNVYNISVMTKKQAEELIAKTEGRLCTKLYSRTDGTIITRDCPYGLRAIKRRVARSAGAILSAILSFFTTQTIVWADHDNCIHYKAKIVKLQSQECAVSIQGTVFFLKDEVLAEAEVTLSNEETKRSYRQKTNAKGQFDFSSLPTGSYNLSIFFRGFATFTKKNIAIKNNESLQLEVMMQVGTTGGAAFLPENQQPNRSLQTKHG